MFLHIKFSSQVHACMTNKSHFELVKRCKRDAFQKLKTNEKRGKGKMYNIKLNYPKMWTSIIVIKI